MVFVTDTHWLVERGKVGLAVSDFNFNDRCRSNTDFELRINYTDHHTTLLHFKCNLSFLTNFHNSIELVSDKIMTE